MHFMKRGLFCVIAICLPFILFCQSEVSDGGIKWTEGLTWKQVQQKAKKENKYIFVDCYATWCKPCKEMDRNVYSVDSVADYLNANFISVKVQMDQTKNDDAATKNWYKTASYMSNQYNLTAYPTMLFFTPSGEVATKEVGYKNPESFITVARNAKDPSKQYYVLLNNYKKGELNHAEKRSLINMAKELKDSSNYRALRNDYFAYLHALPKEKSYTKENIEFIASIIGSRRHVVFDMFYPDGSAVDEVMGKNGYARKVVDDVIMKEKVARVFNAGIDAKLEPDWDMLYKTIAKDYNDDYAARNTLEAKILWYGNVQPDELKLAGSLNDKMEKYGSDTTNRGEDFKLNNAAFSIWKAVGPTANPSNEEIKELARVTNWMQGVVRRGATATGFRLEQWHLYIDTYANLLHKIGRTSEATKWEEFAIVKLKEFVQDKDEVNGYSKMYEYRLDKMKKGEPTWPIEQK
jgi:thioredoxin-related protein